MTVTIPINPVILISALWVLIMGAIAVLIIDGLSDPFELKLLFALLVFVPPILFLNMEYEWVKFK